MMMSHAQLAGYLQEMDRQRERNRARWDDGQPLPDLPPAVMAAAAVERRRYAELVQRPDASTKAFGSYAELTESMAKLLPPVRDRGAARPKSAGQIRRELVESGKPGINARAIGANAASRLLFPAGLIGKGAMLDYMAEQSPDQQREVLHYLDVTAILKEMKSYSLICDQVFAVLAESGRFRALLEALRSEWDALQANKELLRQELWRRLLGDDFLPVDNDTAENRRYICTMLVPELRELFEDDFTAYHHNRLCSHKAQTILKAWVRAGLYHSVLQGCLHDLLTKLPRFLAAKPHAAAVFYCAWPEAEKQHVQEDELLDQALIDHKELIFDLVRCEDFRRFLADELTEGRESVNDWTAQAIWAVNCFESQRRRYAGWTSDEDFGQLLKSSLTSTGGA